MGVTVAPSVLYSFKRPLDPCWLYLGWCRGRPKDGCYVTFDFSVTYTYVVFLNPNLDGGTTLRPALVFCPSQFALIVLAVVFVLSASLRFSESLVLSSPLLGEPAAAGSTAVLSFSSTCGSAPNQASGFSSAYWRTLGSWLGMNGTFVP